MLMFEFAKDETFNMLKNLYREACYNVQQTKAEHGSGQAYSRACGLADMALALLRDDAHKCAGDYPAEVDRFVFSTYSVR